MSNAVAVIPSMTPAAVDKVRQLETANAERPQVHIDVNHSIHAGVYSRTIIVPAGVLITGALIKIPTILIVSGHAIMYGEGGANEVAGYHVFSAEAGRKQAFVALEDTALTMLFATSATTVEEAEAEFTNETALLTTRREDPPCLE